MRKASPGCISRSNTFDDSVSFRKKRNLCVLVLQKVCFVPVIKHFSLSKNTIFYSQLKCIKIVKLSIPPYSSPGVKCKYILVRSDYHREIHVDMIDPQKASLDVIITLVNK